MIFQNPWFLILLPLSLLPFLYKRIKRKESAVRFSSGKLLFGVTSTLKVKMSAHLGDLRIACFVLIVLAIARPIWPSENYKIKTEGIDIVLAADVSTSMRAEDFTIGPRRVNRLEVAKDVIEEFVEKRPNDKIGMVVFASKAYTVSPITLDKNWLLKNLRRVHIGMVGDGTAIGSGIVSALNRLRTSKAKDKVIILLTDGRNNSGKINPLTAAEAAKTIGVKIYTIGAGSIGPVPYPFRNTFGHTVYQNVKIDIDEDTLEKIASITDARYFRATDTKSLHEIYREIDRLETYPIEERGYTEYTELFGLFLVPGLILLLLEIVLANTILRRIP